MVKRITRRATLAAGWIPPARSAGSTRNRGFMRGRPPTIPQGAYTQAPQTVITGGYVAGLIPASGTLVLAVGPAGVGTVWYPQSASISTTTGANDASTCAIYLSPLVNGGSPPPSTQIGGQSYAGGGDTIGLPVPPIRPGQFVYAVWSGANPGDLAALQVYGQQGTLAA